MHKRVLTLCIFMQVYALSLVAHQPNYGVRLGVQKQVGQKITDKKIQGGENRVEIPACSPGIPSCPPIITPAFNPNAYPGAFFPDPNVTNKLKRPPQTIGVTFVGQADGQDPANTFVTPPDTFGVIGLEQFVMGTNFGFNSFDRQGNSDGILEAQNETLNNLSGDFNLLLSNDDARIYYDRLENRFVSVQANASSIPPFAGFTGFTLSVSDSGILSDETEWTVLSIFDNTIIPDRNGCPGDVIDPNIGVTFDFPCLGIDKHAIYVSFSPYITNQQGEDCGTWISNTLYVIQKKSLYNGNEPAVITAFYNFIKDAEGNLPGDAFFERNAGSTTVPLNNFDDPHPKFGYLLATDPNFYGRLQLFRVLDAGTTKPSLVGPFNIDVLQTFSDISDFNAYPPYSTILYQPFGRLDCIDDRLVDSSHINEKQIYAAHSVFTNAQGIAGGDNPDRLSTRWYQIDVTGDRKGKGARKERWDTKPALVQAGTLFDSSRSNPLYYNVPAIMSNKNHDISICGTVSGFNQPISAFFVGKAGTEPKDGRLRIGKHPPSVYAIGSGAYDVILSVEGQRWGDMSYSSLDPLDKKTIWTVQEIAVDGRQTQVVAELKAP